MARLFKLYEETRNDNRETFLQPNTGPMVNTANIMSRVSTWTLGTRTAALQEAIEDAREGRTVYWHSENVTIVRAYSYLLRTNVFTNIHTALQNATANDAPVPIERAGDYAVFGGDTPYHCLRFLVGTPGVYIASYVWQYWNGSDWATLDCEDDTKGFTVSGNNCVVFEAPSDWATRTIESQTKYYVRIYFTSVTLVTTSPILTQCWQLFVPRGSATLAAGSTTTSLVLNAATGTEMAASNRIVRDTRDCKTAFKYIYWSDIEATRGTLDWGASWTGKNYAGLIWARMKKMRIIYRFIMDYPGSDGHNDLPAWLMGVGYLNNDGIAYTNANTTYGGGFCPNYDNPILIAEYQRILPLIAERILGQRTTYGVQFGILGHWGENHTHSSLNYFPEPATVQTYLNTFLDNFYGKTYIGIRRPYGTYLQGKFGAFNDSLGNYSQVYGTAMGAIDDWTDGYTDQWGDAWDPAGYDWTQVAPVAGEIVTPRDSQNNTSSNYYDNFGPTFYPNLYSHLVGLESTLIGINPDIAARATNGDTIMNHMLRKIGYRMYVNRAQLKAPKKTITTGDTVTMKVFINNFGLAKFYQDYNQNWTFEVTLINDSDAVAQTVFTSIDADEIQMGENSFEASFSVTVSAGTYSVAVALIDPYTGLPGVRFAQTARNDKRHVILSNVVIS